MAYVGMDFGGVRPTLLISLSRIKWQSQGPEWLVRIDNRPNFETRNRLITLHSICLNLRVVLLDWPPPKDRKLILLCYLIHTWEREVERDGVMLFPKDISTKAVGQNFNSDHRFHFPFNSIIVIVFLLVWLWEWRWLLVADQSKEKQTDLVTAVAEEG